MVGEGTWRGEETWQVVVGWILGEEKERERWMRALEKERKVKEEMRGEEGTGRNCV